MEKVRVVHSRDVWLQGTETWLYNQIKYLNEYIEPHVICRQVENLDQFSVANIHQLDVPSYFEWYRERVLRKLGFHASSYQRSILRELKKIKPSILHSHFGHAGWLEVPVAKKAGLRHIVTFYGFDVSRLPNVEPVWKQRYKQLFRQVHLVLCEGPFMAQRVIDLGCSPNKVRVHHLGVAVDKIPFKPRTWQKGQTLRVLIAASFVEKKGIPYALEALGEIKDMVPLEITIIGDADAQTRSQTEKKKILDSLKRFRLEDNVRLLGYQPHAVLLKESYGHHIFISPSVTAIDGDSEGGAPVGLIEMAATGMPIVSTKHCDIPEVVQDGKTGLLAEERDVPGLVSRVRWLVQNPDKWVHLLENSRKHVEKEYNAKDQGVKLSEVYKAVVEQ